MVNDVTLGLLKSWDERLSCHLFAFIENEINKLNTSYTLPDLTIVWVGLISLRSSQTYHARSSLLDWDILSDKPRDKTREPNLQIYPHINFYAGTYKIEENFQTENASKVKEKKVTKVRLTITRPHQNSVLSPCSLEYQTCIARLPLLPPYNSRGLKVIPRWRRWCWRATLLALITMITFSVRTFSKGRWCLSREVVLVLGLLLLKFWWGRAMIIPRQFSLHPTRPSLTKFLRGPADSNSVTFLRRH